MDDSVPTFCTLAGKPLLTMVFLLSFRNMKRELVVLTVQGGKVSIERSHGPWQDTGTISGL